MSTPTPTHTAVQPLPCPFCGADGHLLIVGEWLRAKWFVSCKACDSDGPAGRDRTSAVDAWNRRASLPAPQGEWLTEFEVSRDGCVQFIAPTLQGAQMYAAAEGAWAFEINEVRRRVVNGNDSRPSSVAPGGQPLAQPNSQDGDSVLPPVEPPGATLSQGAIDVLAERRRQVEAEGWTPEHDDAHNPGELAEAGACYAMAFEHQPTPIDWPWEVNWWKPRDRRRNLIKASALILAEIERLDRASKVDRGESSSEGGES